MKTQIQEYQICKRKDNMANGIFGTEEADVVTGGKATSSAVPGLGWHKSELLVRAVQQWLRGCDSHILAQNSLLTMLPYWPAFFAGQRGWNVKCHGLWCLINHKSTCSVVDNC